MESKCVGADAVWSGRAGLLIRRQKSGNDYEKRVYTRRGKASLRGNLAQSSRSQTVSAVWERDQRPPEKWSGQGRTSRTGVMKIYTPRKYGHPAGFPFLRDFRDPAVIIGIPFST